MSLVPIDGRTSRYHEKDLSTVKELFNEKKSVVQSEVRQNLLRKKAVKFLFANHTKQTLNRRHKLLYCHVHILCAAFNKERTLNPFL